MLMNYDALILSPHLDDAALSCGGFIHRLVRQGLAVHVITIFTADPPPGPLSPFAAELHARWELAAGSLSVRRDEDAQACELMGVSWEHWDLPDCVYRRDVSGAPLYPTWEDVIAGVHEADHGLIEALAHRLGTLPPAKLVLAPLTVGGHADHRVTHRAAFQWREADVWLYEDYPYAGAPGAVETVVGDHAGWETRVVPLETADLTAKFDAISCYASQLSSFFADRVDLEAKVGGYAALVGGERHWRPTG
jgi:LmbE family N-acetylglucosaminyl deacetylase